MKRKEIPSVRPQKVLADDFLGEARQIDRNARSRGPKPLGEEQNDRDDRSIRKASPRRFEGVLPNRNEQYDVLHYSGGEIEEYDKTPIPRFLLWSYLILPIIGILWGVVYWNGSGGWFSRNHWFQLEQVANTTFPSDSDCHLILNLKSL